MADVEVSRDRFRVWHRSNCRQTALACWSYSLPMLSIFKTAFPSAYLRMKLLAGRLFIDEVNRLTLQHCGSCVIDGPFKGMRYIERANCSALSPKLLGTYEREIATRSLPRLSN